MSESIDFHFYLKCAKPLIFALTSLTDRSLASAWLKRLAEDPSISEEVKSEYVKHLIYLLQKRKLDGPFATHPSKFKDLSKFSQMFEVKSPKRDEGIKPYSFDFSGDLRTYVSYQDIDNFGVHCYYALSNEPVTAWDRCDKSLFPAGTRLKPKALLLEDNGGSEEFSKCPEDQQLKEKKQELAEKIQKKVRGDNRKVVFLVAPIGKQAKEDDDRVPPSWGSNLI